MSCHLSLLNRCVVQVSESGGKGQRSFQQTTPTIFLINCQPYILYWYVVFSDNMILLHLPPLLPSPQTYNQRMCILRVNLLSCFYNLSNGILISVLLTLHIL